jgi:hypothetical protein
MPTENSTSQKRSPEQSAEERVAVNLESLARQATLELGAALNSPIHEAMLKLARRVWEFAQGAM